MTEDMVSAVTPTGGTLLEAAYANPDYRDAYLVTTKHPMPVEDFATGFFLSQPRWLARVSMNLGDDTSRRHAIEAREYAEGSSVGSWRIHGRADNEIVFGEHMGFMEYRFSMLRRPDGRIEAGTTVRYLKRFGPIYFAFVKPFHRGFIRIVLKNAARHAVDHASCGVVQ